MAKRRAKKNRTPNLSPLSVLRPRLDALWREPPSEQNESFAKLDSLTRDSQPADFLPILVTAYALAAEEIDPAWGDVLADWVAQREYVGALTELTEQLNLDADAQQVALAWLNNSGVDTAQLDLERPASFFDAYWGGDDLDSQNFLILLWYTNARRNRVQGINFLIDNNPPWDGAIKDALPLASRSPREALRDHVSMWQARSAFADQIDGAQAKHYFLEALAQNQSQSIRLSRDTIALREQIRQHIFSLPDDNDTPDFTLDDFDEIAKLGKAAEEIMHSEQTLGYRVRMKGGSEVLMLDPDMPLSDEELAARLNLLEDDSEES